MLQKPSDIPPDVLGNYFGGQKVDASLLGRGEINATYLIRSSGKKFILQRLSPIFSEKVIEDFDAVTGYLETDGWEVPRMVPAKNGHPYYRDNHKGLWRLMTYIGSDNDMPGADAVERTFHEYGALLGKLHASLAKFDYRPQFKIPHFHDTVYYAGRLKKVMDELPRNDQPIAGRILAAYDNLPELPAWTEQLLHGDPRTDNMLFRGGEPFTYIDFDTVMFGQVWVDLGDLLRSLAEDQQAKYGSVDASKLGEVIEGYRQAAHSQTDPDQFRRWGMAAMQTIALELAMRYMIDVVEDYYFSWNAEKFASRRQSHLSRAQEQLRIAGPIQ